MKRLALAFAAALAPAAASAEQICIDAVDGFRLIRCVDTFGFASCEFLANGQGILRCVAFDATGEPIAAGTAFAENSSVDFQDVEAGTIDTVICD